MIEPRQTLIAMQPEKARSPLGKTIARLLQVAGLEIDINEFGDIDEIAKSITSIHNQQVELHDWFEQIEEKVQDVQETLQTDQI